MVFLGGSNKAVETPKVKAKSEFEFIYEKLTKRVDDFIIFCVFHLILSLFQKPQNFPFLFILVNKEKLRPFGWMNERLKSQASLDIFFIIDEGAKECDKMGIFFIGKKSEHK